MSSDRLAEAARQDIRTGRALDWLLNWAMGQDSEAEAHYWHINDGTEESCDCKYIGED